MNSLWWELWVLGEPALDEVLSWELQSMGCQGTSSQIKGSQIKICGYFAQSQVSETRLAQMAQQLKQVAADLTLTVANVAWCALKEEDWANSWKEYWHSTPVGNRLLIHPAWLPLPEHNDRILLRLDPGVAFGTGAHATTQLCLVALEAQFLEPVSHPCRVADIGCGTGILAIAALSLGADWAIAVDTDPLAVQAAQECRDLNQIDASCMVVTLGSMAEAIAQMQQPVDGFCCNILAPVIIELMPQMKALTKSAGWGILSGLLQKQVPEVIQSLAVNGWQVQQSWQQEDWACLKITRD